MARRHYSDEDRASALAVLEANGGNVSQTSRELGIPRGTLRRWQAGGAPPPAQMRQEKKASLLDLLEERLRQILGIPVSEDAGLQSLAIFAGVLFDKYLLLQGKATQRVAIGDDYDEKSDAELKSIIAEAESIVREAGSGST